MSRARNRADGDFGDLDITNIGAVSLDSIKGDADGNTSLAFSGSDVITITTGGTTAMTIDASQNTTLAGTLTAVTSLGIGSAVLTEAELEFLDGITAGTAAASKVLILDSNKDIGTIRNLTIDGTFSDGNYTFDTSGNVSGLGTVASGNITSSGTVQGTTITATTAFVPDASDGAALGTTALEFSDLFLADGAVISLGDDDDVTLTHVADTGILLNSTMALQFNDASQFINAPSATVLDINATDEIELNATLVDINANLDVSGTYAGAGLMTTGGNIVIPDAGTIGSASDTNAIGISSGGVISITATTANTSATDGALTVAGGLGIAADVSIGDDLRLISDAAVLGFGADTDVTLTHVADTGVLLNAAMVVQFRDSAINIGSPADGDLDINADDEIELNSTLIDINGNVEISGTTAQVGVSTSTAKDIFNAGMSTKNGATSAGFVEFFEDSDNGTNKVTVIGPASTADVTLTLPNSAGTIATTATAADEATALAIALG
jgi:hypothetical protein